MCLGGSAEVRAYIIKPRTGLFPSLRENADFLVGTVKASIKEGELKTNHILRDIKMS
jgi:hypothetical protein